MKNVPLSNYRWVMLGVLWLVHCAGYLNVAGLGNLAPFIKTDLALSSFQFGLLVSAVSVGSALNQMPAGLLSDFLGARIMLAAAVGTTGAAIALFSFSPHFAVALLALLLYGGGLGIVGPATSRSIIDWFPPIGLATAMGIKQTGVNFGGIFAGLFFPALALIMTWRQSFLAVGLVLVAAAVLVYTLAREGPGVSRITPKPLDWGKMLRMAMQRDTLILGSVAFCFMAGQFCISIYLILFLTQEMGLPIIQAGRYFALAFLAGAAGRIFWSMVSDYAFAGRRKGVLCGVALLLLVASLGLGMLSFYPGLSPLLLPLVVAYGVSGIGWNALYLTILGESAGRESTGLVTGAGYFYGFMGSLVVPPLFGLLVDATGHYGWAWLLISGGAATSLVLLCFYREKKTPAGGE
jgi:sugar phosphate permease